MVKKFERIIPVGINAKKELTAIIAGLVLAVLRSLFYFDSYYHNYHQLYEYYSGKKILVDGRKMTDFYILIDGCFEGFYIATFLLIALIVFHYLYHYKDSKCIYTMKRLPKKSELHKRCITLPLICILICQIIPALLLLVYFKHYMATTPPECLVEGQWHMLISNRYL